MKYIIYTLVIAMFGFAFGTATIIGQDNKAKWECNHWAAQLSLAPETPVTELQKEQCNFYNIPLYMGTSTITTSTK